MHYIEIRKFMASHRIFSFSVWAVFVWVFGFGWPAIQSKLNPPPAKTELSEFNGRIVSARNNRWNLDVIDKNGFHQRLKFPAPILGNRYFGDLSRKEINALSGCDAEIFVAPFKYEIFRDYRVWEVRCENVTISYERISREYDVMRREQVDVIWVTAIGAVALVFLYIFGLKKNK